MLLRFVTSIPDGENSGEFAGVFQASGWIRDRQAAPQHQLDRLVELRDWFNEHLVHPPRFNRSRRPHRTQKALSWFRDTAHEHIRLARELATIVAACGYPIREINTDRPGYVVYEDEFQVVAEPFAETPR